MIKHSDLPLGVRSQQKDHLLALTQRHEAIMNLILDGWTPTQIARKFEMNPKSVMTIVHSPNFQHRLAIRRAHISDQHDERLTSVQSSADEKIRAATLEAADRLISAMDSVDEKLAFSAYLEILDRGGCPKVSKVNQTNQSMSIILDGESAERLARALVLDKQLGGSDMPVDSPTASTTGQLSEETHPDKQLEAVPPEAGSFLDNLIKNG